MADNSAIKATIAKAAADANSAEPASKSSKIPRTARGRKTMRAILDAAAIEFGEHGFGETSIVSITRRADVALGSFYTYFNSKEEVFRALVNDLSSRVASHAASAMSEWPDAIAREKMALTAFLQFAREHKEIYRIIDESEFVDPQGYRDHYSATASRIFSRLQEGSAAGDLADDLTEAHAWAIMGMNVFLGLRYGVWSEDHSAEEIAAVASGILTKGIGKNAGG